MSRCPAGWSSLPVLLLSGAAAGAVVAEGSVGSAREAWVLLVGPAHTSWLSDLENSLKNL